jgi:hypothetical protein
LALSAGPPRAMSLTKVDELAESLFVEADAGEVPGQHALERRVVALDLGHRGVNDGADLWLRSIGPQKSPARSLGNPEDAGGGVFVGIFGVGTLRLLRFELGVLRLECVGNVLEKNQAEDDVLVLRRVHVIAERIRHAPELRFKTWFSTSCQLGHSLGSRVRKNANYRTEMPALVARECSVPVVEQRQLGCTDCGASASETTDSISVSSLEWAGD